MPVTSAPARGDTGDTRVRLRRDVFDALVAERNARTVDEQVALLGVSRRTLFRMRRGESPSLASAMRTAEALGVPLTALFERTGEAA